jgi:hypothetical protein
MVGVNTARMPLQVAMFDGMKKSGIDREGSKNGMDKYLKKNLCTSAEFDKKYRQQIKITLITFTRLSESDIVCSCRQCRKGC